MFFNMGRKRRITSVPPYSREKLQNTSGSTHYEAGRSSAPCRHCSHNPHSEVTPIHNPSTAAHFEDEELFWSINKEDRLIELYRERPFLYDLSSPCYQNRYKKAKAMREMVEELGVSAKDINTRWRSLRDTFTRLLRQPSGSGTKDMTERCKSIYEKLAFLRSHVRHRNTSAKRPRPCPKSQEPGSVENTDEPTEGDDEEIFNWGTIKIENDLSSTSTCSMAQEGPGYVDNTDELLEGEDEETFDFPYIKVEKNYAEPPSPTPLPSSPHQLQPGTSTAPAQPANASSTSKTLPTGKKNDAVCMGDAQEHTKQLSDTQDTLAYKPPCSNVVQVKKLSRNELWARVFAGKLDELPPRIQDDVRLYCDSVVAAAARGTWFPPTADSIFLGSMNSSFTDGPPSHS